MIEGMHLVRMSPAEHVAQFGGPKGRIALHEVWQASSGVILAGLPHR